MSRYSVSLCLICAISLSLGCTSLPSPVHQKRVLDQFVRASDAMADFLESDMPTLVSTQLVIAIVADALQPQKPSSVSAVSLVDRFQGAENAIKDAGEEMRASGRLVSAMFSKNESVLKKTLRDLNLTWKGLIEKTGDSYYVQFIMDEEMIERIRIGDLDTKANRERFATLFKQNCDNLMPVWDSDMKKLKEIESSIIPLLRARSLAISNNPEQPSLLRLAAAEKFAASLELSNRVDALQRKAKDAIRTYCEASQQVADNLPKQNYTLEDFQAIVEKIDQTVKTIEQMRAIATRIAALLMFL